MNEPCRVEPLGVGGDDRLTVRAVTVFCAAQLMMLLANLGRIPLLSTGDRDVPITLNEVALGVMLATGILVALASRTLRLDRIAVIALLFAAVGAGSAVWSVQRFGMSLFELLIALAFLARWMVYFGVYLVVINVFRDRDVESLWRAVETMLVVFAAFGIFQSAFLPDFAQLVYPDSRAFIDWDPQGHRLVSTVLEPNIAGAMLMIGLLVQIGRVSVGAHASRWRMLVIFLGLLLTLSRSAALGLMFGLVVIVIARGLSKRVLRLGIVAGALLMLASPFLIRYALAYSKFSLGAGTSAGARLESWAMALRVIADYPVFGIGFNAYKYAAQSYGSAQIGASSYNSDGGLLFVLALTGFVGLTVYCLMLWGIVRRCRSIWRDVELTPENRGLAIGTAAATIGVVTQSTFVNAIMTTFIMEILWVLWGLTFLVAHARDSRAISAAVHRRPRLVGLAA